MSFQIIEIGGKNIAVGMDWPYSNGEPEAKAAELEAKGYIALSNDTNDIVGIAPELPKKNRLYPLAALCVSFAEAKHAAFVMSLDEQSIAFIGLLDGLPVNGYDKVVHPDGIHNILDKYLQDAGEDAGVIAYTNVREIASDYHDIAKRIDIEDLVGQLEDKKFAESTRVKALSGNIWPWLLWIGVLICAAGFMGWKWYQDKKMLEQAQQEAAQQKSPQQIYDESLAAAYSKAGWSLKEALRVLDAISEPELKRGGWKADRIVCSQARNGCEIDWKKEGAAATYATFAEETPDMTKVLYVQDGIREVVSVATEPLRGWRTAELPSKVTIYNGVLSSLQRLTATGDVQTSYRDPAPYATNGQTIPAPAFQGGITFSGDAYLLPMLSRIDGSFISVSEIELAFSGEQPTFKVEFNYYTGQP